MDPQSGHVLSNTVLQRVQRDHSPEAAGLNWAHPSQAEPGQAEALPALPAHPVVGRLPTIYPFSGRAIQRAGRAGPGPSTSSPTAAASSSSNERVLLGEP